jgi:hypothetical protein
MRQLSKNNGSKTNMSERYLYVLFVDRRKLARKFFLLFICYARVSTSNNAGVCKQYTDIVYAYKTLKLMRNLHLLYLHSSLTLGVVVAITQ